MFIPCTNHSPKHVKSGDLDRRKKKSSPEQKEMFALMKRVAEGSNERVWTIAENDGVDKQSVPLTRKYPCPPVQEWIREIKPEGWEKGLRRLEVIDKFSKSFEDAGYEIPERAEQRDQARG